MNANELRNNLEALGISQVDFARLISVSQRSISLWLSGERDVSSPAAAYLRLLMSLPSALQLKELSRIRQGDTKMVDGMYKLDFRGAQGEGVGVLVLDRGRVYGSDEGVLYDGTYELSPIKSGYVDAKLYITVPSGIGLVQGVPPQPMQYGFDLECSFMAGGASQFAVQTPFGPVQASMSFLRPIPN
jgi:transcriptional regulator with XRE-family HTH domain